MLTSSPLPSLSWPTEWVPAEGWLLCDPVLLALAVLARVRTRLN
jgi:hypothetical protein